MSGTAIVGGSTVVVIGHQVLFVKGSLRLRFEIMKLPLLYTDLICLTTLLPNPVVVVNPVEIFQSMRGAVTDDKDMNPVGGKVKVCDDGLQEKDVSC
jgi:hypothetical protein